MVALAAGLLVVAASPAVAQGTGDAVIASGRAAPSGYPPGYINDFFMLEARSGPTGEHPAGAVELNAVLHDSPAVTLSGDVACLSVLGSDAVIGVVVTANDFNE